MILSAEDMWNLALFTIIVLAFVWKYSRNKKVYEQTEYYQQTNIPYWTVLHNKGNLGEYYTYDNLKELNGYKRFLFNVYIPKENGETTEIDVILLHESGIYVFESKNYGGWIFGNENQRYWKQTFRTERNWFFNPIMQNKTHIKWLQKYLDNGSDLPFYSFILFSDRCQLVNITLTSGKHFVIHRHDVLNAVNKVTTSVGTRLTPDEIDELHYKLYSLTQVSEAEKQQHIKDVQKKYNKKERYYNL